MLRRTGACLALSLAATLVPVARAQAPGGVQTVFGYGDFTEQSRWDKAFLAVPDAKLAGEHLKTLTAEPHWASSPQDRKTAEYVAEKFRAAGLQTTISEYRVLLNRPLKVEITATDKTGRQLMQGPTPEHVDSSYGGDPFQDNPDILPAFNGSSGSGDVTAPAVYANYGTLEDFDRLKELGIDVRGKIVLVRYGQNFRGVKAYIAQQRGAAGVIIYSDPADDGYARGDKYPRGPYRPDSAVQRGSVQFLPLYAGDPETPGIASTPDLPDSKRITDLTKVNQPQIPVNPLSYKDAAPILEALGGKNVPHEWQGALPFAYHLGNDGAVKVHMHLEQEYKLRPIWDVIGVIEGSDPLEKDNWVVAGNHRDAWVYGAVDPNSGTAAMLESVHGLGELLKQGWRPKRRIVVASWDAEEEGLVGSTEWAEEHAAQLAHAVAYFNTDVAVSGPNFTAAAVPSLQQFVQEVAAAVPSPKGSTVLTQWASSPGKRNIRPTSEPRRPHVGELGSGSDYTPFFQHLGVPSTDIGSEGPYGVYHSAFDNYNWFVRNADPTFVYEQQQARVLGLEILRMADARVLPYSYRDYGEAIGNYISAAEHRGDGSIVPAGSFTAVRQALQRFNIAAQAVSVRQESLAASGSAEQLAAMNAALRNAESALLSDAGLPKRPWYRHLIYAPGEYTGYAAVVIPGINEALDAHDAATVTAQLDALSNALQRAATVLDAASHP